MMPILTTTHLDKCRFSAWYQTFEAITFPSEIIPLSAEFVDYLRADGLVLPLNVNGETVPFYKNDDTSSDCDSFASEDGEEAVAPSFPELESTLIEKIASLGGSVFPKLNWSAPKDATWITLTGSLKCTTMNDIIILLKSSDFIAHDVLECYGQCDDVDDAESFSAKSYELVLREWCDVNPAMEFRCFVLNRRLVGISQRDVFNYYPYLEECMQELKRKIVGFFREQIQDVFELENYIFDVYAGRNGNRMFLVDINPFSVITDMLLFTEEELLSDLTTPQEMRIIRSQAAANEQSMGQPAYNSNRLPKDAFDINSGNFTIDELILLMNEDANVRR